MLMIIGAGITLVVFGLIAYAWCNHTKVKKAWRVKGNEHIAFKSMYEAIRYAKLIGLEEEEGMVYYD